MDTDDDRQIALVSVEFCFNYDFNAELIQWIDWMDGYDGLKAIVAAMPSWRVGMTESQTSWCQSRAGASAIVDLQLSIFQCDLHQAIGEPTYLYLCRNETISKLKKEEMSFCSFFITVLCDKVIDERSL